MSENRLARGQEADPDLGDGANRAIPIGIDHLALASTKRCAQTVIYDLIAGLFIELA
jgi:hypothetical protein